MRKPGVMVVMVAIAVSACSTASPDTSESIFVPDLPTTPSSLREPVPTTLPSTSSPPTAPATTARGTTAPPRAGPETLAVRDLGSPVLAYGYADREELVLIGRQDQRALMAGGVGLGLGPDLVEQTMSGHLSNPDAWSLPGPFRAHTGPFSAIELLTQADEPQVAAGPHAHCGAPPAPAPEEVSDLSRVSLQPAAPESCLQWWTVDLFLTEVGDITAITLDLWEP